MIDHLQNLADVSSWPILTAFLLGLITAISPCPLATNITATAYLSKEIGNKRQILFNGISYTLGRIFTTQLSASRFILEQASFELQKYYREWVVYGSALH